MKVHVMRNAKGEVIATFEKQSHEGVRVEPLVPEGHSIEEVDASENYHRDLASFYKQHQR